MFAPNDEALVVVRQWVDKAEHDLQAASHLLKLGETCPTDVVCFHAQQCVEKYLKALLVLRNVEFSRIHHLSVLIERLPADIRIDLTPEEQERLTDYAVTARYPGDYDPIPFSEAQEAVETARRARRQARRYLPRIALQ